MQAPESLCSSARDDTWALLCSLSLHYGLGTLSRQEAGVRVLLASWISHPLWVLFFPTWCPVSSAPSGPALGPVVQLSQMGGQAGPCHSIMAHSGSYSLYGQATKMIASEVHYF